MNVSTMLQVYFVSPDFESTLLVLIPEIWVVKYIVPR